MRYPASALLACAAAVVLAGARSLVAIGEWVADAPRAFWPGWAFGRSADRRHPSAPHGQVRLLLLKVEATRTPRIGTRPGADGPAVGTAGDRGGWQDAARLAHL
ncbi:hypothetical protein ABZZ74_30125 [Streptomyces sp. NPDC006476]|uniref:hypothetical protein n=1 Tax=Streptomyces sp. NPDC006476 TaxID=3157175 RepID=UPI0033AFD5F1